MSVIPHPTDRRCTHVSPTGVRCITVLCQFNPGKECFAHTPREVPLPKRGELERLMRQDDERISA